jgi:hypothetical protein
MPNYRRKTRKQRLRDKRRKQHKKMLKRRRERELAKKLIKQPDSPRPENKTVEEEVEQIKQPVRRPIAAISIETDSNKQDILELVELSNQQPFGSGMENPDFSSNGITDGSVSISSLSGTKTDEAKTGISEPDVKLAEGDADEQPVEPVEQAIESVDEQAVEPVEQPIEPIEPIEPVDIQDYYLTNEYINYIMKRQNGQRKLEIENLSKEIDALNEKNKAK